MWGNEGKVERLYRLVIGNVPGLCRLSAGKPRGLHLGHRETGFYQ